MDNFRDKVIKLLEEFETANGMLIRELSVYRDLVDGDFKVELKAREKSFRKE